MSVRTFVVFMGVLAIIGLLAYGVISKGHGTLAEGETMPTTALPKLDGSGTGSLADYDGKWVLVNVWASWCVPCRNEAPALESFYRDHRGGDFEILGIDTQETDDGGRGFVSDFGLTYPQLHDGEGTYADDLKTTGVPENFLVDPDGTLALAQRGPVDARFLREQVGPMIEGS